MCTPASGFADSRRRRRHSTVMEVVDADRRMQGTVHLILFRRRGNDQLTKKTVACRTKSVLGLNIGKAMELQKIEEGHWTRACFFSSF